MSEAAGASAELSGGRRAVAARAHRARQGLSADRRGGLLEQLTKMVDRERPGPGEMNDHLGYSKNTACMAPESANPRNGHRAKTVITEAAARSEISCRGTGIPRFEPQIVRKRQRRLTRRRGDRRYRFHAKGLTHRGDLPRTSPKSTAPSGLEADHLAITDRVIDGMAAWQSRPLDHGLRGGVRRRDPRSRSATGQVANRPVYLAIRASPLAGERTSWACGPGTGAAKAPSSGLRRPFRDQEPRRSTRRPHRSSATG